jgi:hypothetical protein
LGSVYESFAKLGDTMLPEELDAVIAVDAL